MDTCSICGCRDAHLDENYRWVQPVHGTPTKAWRKAHPDWTSLEHPPRTRPGCPPTLALWMTQAVGGTA